MSEIENLKLQHPTYWSRNPNIWGSLSDWDIYFIDKVPGCNKREAHRSLSVELDILLDNLPRKNRRFSKANALKKALEVSLYYALVAHLLFVILPILCSRDLSDFSHKATRVLA
ncbi:hypothetical protein Glove_144g125 [Diversispora epigaea]|uniref:Uncharacterized protein n=1 Tax=Diversispora epigaea TaxID=1348612 RepID=A0A397J3P1_9GLOM|nr:hypothetical protein Glove_144g125 [Diversispora epigaea]